MTTQQQELREEIVALREDIVRIRAEKTPSAASWNAEVKNYKFANVGRSGLKIRRTLSIKEQGRVAKVDFGRNREIMSLSTGAMSPGNIILWNSMNQTKKKYIKCANSFMITAAIDKVDGDLVACGGLAKDLHVYQLEDSDDPADAVVTDPIMENLETKSPIYSLNFVDKEQMVSAGESYMISLWDIATASVKTEFQGHTGDIFSVDVNPTNPDLLLSGAGDFTARLWSLKEKQMSHHPRAGILYTFDVESRDVNDAKWFPDGSCFATALNNSEVNLYDMRANCKLLTFADTDVTNKTAAESVCFSKSGRLMFVKYQSQEVRVYDVISEVMNIGSGDLGTRSTSPGNPIDIGNERVTSMAIDSEGTALALGTSTHGGSDTTVRVLWR